MRNYKSYEIWVQGKQLSVDIYRFTQDFPKDEKFGIVSQMRRAAVSIPSNIAEGASRESEKDFKRFLNISLGSLFELDTQLEIVAELNLGNNESLNSINENLIQVRKMLIDFIKSFK